MSEVKKGISGVGQVRLSRPTNQLEEIIRFYCDGLGLALLLRFEKDQAGYSGAILGIAGTDIHLEFVSHEDGFSPKEISPPTEDHLLVLYLDESKEYEQISDRLGKLGWAPVAAKNPHWDLDGITYLDPDGWRVVLMLKRNI